MVAEMVGLVVAVVENLRGFGWRSLRGRESFEERVLVVGKKEEVVVAVAVDKQRWVGEERRSLERVREAAIDVELCE